MLVPYSNVVGLSTTSTECVLTVSCPPLMWCTRMRDDRVDVDAPDGPWESIGDFTEGVASSAREHRLKGDASTRSTLLNIITSSPELSHLVSPPSSYIQLPRRSSKSASHSPGPSAGTIPHSLSAPNLPTRARVSSSGPATSFGRLSLGPNQHGSGGAPSSPFTFQQLPPARPYSSAGERSTAPPEPHSTFGGPSGTTSRPWTAGDWDQPRIAIEHASAPLPPNTRYLPAQVGSSSSAPEPLDHYSSADGYLAVQDRSVSYSGPTEQPTSAGSDMFRYEHSSYRMEGPQSYDAPMSSYDQSPTSAAHPHQRFISAPLPTAHTEARPPSSSSSRAHVGYYSASQHQSGPAHPSPPSSTSTQWQNRSFDNNGWQYGSGSAPSSASIGHPRASSASSGFDFLPEFGPDDGGYVAPPPRPYQVQGRPQNQPQVVQYGLSPPPSADKVAFEHYPDGNEVGPYEPRGPTHLYQLDGGRGGHGTFH